MAVTTDHPWHAISSADARRRHIKAIQAIFAGAATVGMLVLFHNVQPDVAKSVGAPGSVRLADRATDLSNLFGAGGFAADDDDDEARLQQQLQAQQQMQQAEQQAEEQEQLDNQEAQQAEHQGLRTEQEANLAVPGS